MAALSWAGAAATAVVAGSAEAAASLAGAPAQRCAAISPSVRSVPRCSGPIVGVPGTQKPPKEPLVWAARQGQTGTIADLVRSGRPPAAFVCEEDVRAAVKDGRQILIGEKTIITPSARDLGEASRIFRETGWPGASR